MTPAQVAEALIGPPPVLGPALGVSVSAPFQWRYQRGRRDAGDFPSAAIMRRLLAYSSARGLGLTEKHLIWGATATEIEEILAARRDGPAVAAE